MTESEKPFEFLDLSKVPTYVLDGQERFAADTIELMRAGESIPGITHSLEEIVAGRIEIIEELLLRPDYPADHVRHVFRELKRLEAGDYSA